ncbi:MAG: N-acetyltransferase family protein [Halanaerobiales bacterium]
MREILIRKAELKDLKRITEIYNQAVINTVATFDTEPKTIESRIDWFTSHDDRYPVLVAEADIGVTGWASLSLWSDKCAYSNTAELSIYIDEGQRGKGIGNKLMCSIIDHVRKTDCHTIISRIAGENEVSIYLHEKYGFELIGTMKEVGYKFGRYIDVHIYQIII